MRIRASIKLNKLDSILGQISAVSFETLYVWLVHGEEGVDRGHGERSKTGFGSLKHVVDQVATITVHFLWLNINTLPRLPHLDLTLKLH